MVPLVNLYVNLFIAVLIGAYQSQNRWYQSCLEYPSTFLHELAHWIFALVFKGYPSNFTLKPVILKDKIILGSVSAHLNQLNGGLISLAPMWYWVIALIIIEKNMYLSPSYFVLEIIAGLLLKAGTPSTQDLSLSLKSPFSSIVVLAAMYICVYPVISIVFT